MKRYRLKNRPMGSSTSSDMGIAYGRRRRKRHPRGEPRRFPEVKSPVAKNGARVIHVYKTARTEPGPMRSRQAQTSCIRCTIAGPILVERIVVEGLPWTCFSTGRLLSNREAILADVGCGAGVSPSIVGLSDSVSVVAPVSTTPPRARRAARADPRGRARAG